jgi:dynein heavy chain
VWGSIQALKELEDYASLPDDLLGSSKRWREWMELERPGACVGVPRVSTQP